MEEVLQGVDTVIGELKNYLLDAVVGVREDYSEQEDSEGP